MIEPRTTKAGKTYYLARVKSGRKLVASKSFDTKREAQTWERKQKHLIETGRPLAPKRSFTLQELMTMFLAAREGGNPHTVDTDRNNLAALPDTMLARPLATIQADDIRGHLLAELRGGKKPSTVARAKTPRAIRVHWLSEIPLPQLHVERSHSDGYDEKAPKSWRGTRPVPLSPRALAIFRQYAAGKSADDYLFTNQQGGQLSVGVARKFPLGFRRHALRHYAAPTWLRLGTPVHEVAEYLGDEARTVLAVYAHVLGEGQRRDHIRRLAAAESFGVDGGHPARPRPRTLTSTPPGEP